MRVRVALILSLSLSIPVTTLYAAGDADRGATLYEARCTGCHSLDTNRVGPMDQGVIGRKAGRVNGYLYSDALRKSTVVWSAMTLDQWLTDPESLIPGQKMGYSVSAATDRADIIAYLTRQSTAR